MLYGTYLSATGMALNQNQQDVIANNLANVDTAGFKRDLSVFQERRQEARGANRAYRPEHLKDVTGGAFVADVTTDFTPGTMQTTNRNLDVALNGPGFLCVRDGNETRFTRDGRLELANGKLVLATDGKPVLDKQGQEITLPDASARDITIDSNGNVRVKNQSVAELGVVDFDDPQKLRKVGGNLYDAADAAPHAAETPVMSGVVESSGVNPARELVAMIKLSRSFELNAQMLSLQDQTLGRLVNELPKV